MAFFGMRISHNLISAGYPPRTPLGSLGRSPGPLVGWEVDTLPISHTLDAWASHCGRLWRRGSVPLA